LIHATRQAESLHPLAASLPASQSAYEVFGKVARDMNQNMAKEK